MFVINSAEISVPPHLGGAPRTTDKLNETCMQWLVDAAATAEKLISSEDFITLMNLHGPPHGAKARQISLMRNRIQAAVDDLKVDKIIVNIAELDGEDMVSYIRRSRDANRVSREININKSLILQLYKAYMEAPDTVESGKRKADVDVPNTKGELRDLWVALLAAKIYHESAHVLLTILDNASMRLIGVAKDGSQRTPEKVFVDTDGSKLTFADFGNLMEKAAFGGILYPSDRGHDELWGGNQLRMSLDERWKKTVEVTNVASILEGILEPPEVKSKESSAEEPDAKASKRPSGSGASSSSTGDAIAAEAPDDANPFLPVHEWNKEGLVTKDTKRP